MRLSSFLWHIGDTDKVDRRVRSSLSYVRELHKPSTNCRSREKSAAIWMGGSTSVVSAVSRRGP